jgi:hypothetical protein
MAIAAWREMMMSYPNFSEGFLYIVYAEQELGRNTEQSEKFLRNSLEKSQIYSDDEKAEILNEIEK